MPEQKEFSAIGLPLEVQDAMRNHLPQMMNKLLRDELEKGERAIKDNINLRTEIRKIEARLDELGTLATERRAFKAESAKIADEREEIRIARLELKLYKANIELEMSAKYGMKLETVLAGMVRNTEWRQEAFKSHVDLYNQDGTTEKVESGHSQTDEAT